MKVVCYISSSVVLLTSVLVCACAVFGSCSKTTPPTKEYYEGEFVYFADAASITDCATGMRIPICNDGDYLKAERKYTSFETHGEPVFINFYGRRVLRQSMEGDKMQVMMAIDSLIGFDQTVMCNPEAMLVGIYEGKTPDNKYLVRLKPDYTYTQSIFTLDSDGEQISSGRWYLCASAELVLIQQTPTAESSTFEVVRAQNALVKNSGGKPLVLTKVYI